MKNSIPSLIFGSLLLLLLNSCCRTVDCGPWWASEIRTINFTADEISDFYVRKYEKNSNFTKLVDSIIFLNVINFNRIKTGPNTFTLSLNDSYKIETGFDYELFFPNGNTTKRISDIRDGQSSQKFCNTGFAKKECVNALISLNIDGIPYPALVLEK